MRNKPIYTKLTIFNRGNIYYKYERQRLYSTAVFCFAKFPQQEIFYAKLCDNTGGEKMDVQQEIIFRQIGAKVAYYRTLRGITQEKLAEKMGLHKSVISRIDRGKYHNDLSPATLLKIAEKLQIDPSLFLIFNDLEKKLWWEPLPEDNDDEKMMKNNLEVCHTADFQDFFRAIIFSCS